MKVKANTLGIFCLVLVTVSIGTEMFSDILLHACGIDHVEYYKSHEESQKDSKKLKEMLEDADDKYVESFLLMLSEESDIAARFYLLLPNQLNDVEVLSPPPELVA